MKNYANFTGRARRTEYWVFYLFTTTLGVFTILLDYLCGTSFGDSYTGWITILVGIPFYIPGFAVFVRRLHDIGKSGFFFFLGFIPIVGPIILFVMLCTEGQVGENQYGPDPKQEEEQQADTM